MRIVLEYKSWAIIAQKPLKRTGGIKMDEGHLSLGSPLDAWIRARSLWKNVWNMYVEQDKYRQMTNECCSCTKKSSSDRDPPVVVYRVHAAKFSKKLPWIQEVWRQAKKKLQVSVTITYHLNRKYPYSICYVLLSDLSARTNPKRKLFDSAVRHVDFNLHLFVLWRYSYVVE